MGNKAVCTDNLSLGILKVANPKAYNAAMSYILIDSYDDFLARLYSAIDKIIISLQKNPQIYGEMTEDQLTQIIIDRLSDFDFNAYSDPNVGGHVDLSVDYPGESYLWLGEAKIDNNKEHVYEGFLQLTTRYATGEKNQTAGGIIIYIKNHPIVDFMNGLKEHFQQQINPRNIEVCPNRGEAAFSMETNLPRVGGNISYHIRSMGVSLHFLPEDKSGRTAKKHQLKRNAITAN